MLSCLFLVLVLVCSCSSFLLVVIIVLLLVVPARSSHWNHENFDSEVLCFECWSSFRCPTCASAGFQHESGANGLLDCGVEELINRP